MLLARHGDGSLIHKASLMDSYDLKILDRLALNKEGEVHEEDWKGFVQGRYPEPKGVSMLLSLMQTLRKDFAAVDMALARAEGVAASTKFEEEMKVMSEECTLVQAQLSFATAEGKSVTTNTNEVQQLLLLQKQKAAL